MNSCGLCRGTRGGRVQRCERHPSATRAPPERHPSATRAPPEHHPSATRAPPQRHPSATPAPPQRHPSTTPAPPQRLPSATPAPPQRHPSATPAPPQRHPSATPALASFKARTSVSNTLWGVCPGLQRRGWHLRTLGTGCLIQRRRSRYSMLNSVRACVCFGGGRLAGGRGTA